MYIDVDESDENRDNFNILSCIHDVKFAVRSKFEQFSVHRVIKNEQIKCYPNFEFN